MWNPACCCKLLRVGFRLKLFNASHVFVGVAYRNDDASLCCNLIDMFHLGFPITLSARGDIIRDGGKTVFHPTKPVQSPYRCEWITQDGTHECYCEIRESQILYSVDGQIAVCFLSEYHFRLPLYRFQNLFF